jgi:hypothetical protein
MVISHALETLGSHDFIALRLAVERMGMDDAPLVQSSDLGDAPMKSDCGKLFGTPSLRLLSIIVGSYP